MPKGFNQEWPDDLLQKVIDLYNAGMSLTDVAKATGLTPVPVGNKLRKLGITRNRKQAKTASIAIGTFRSGLPIVHCVCKICKESFTHNVKTLICFDCVPDEGKARAIAIEYGISKVDYDAIVLKQNGKCAICKIKDARCIDHDHVTGKVRGLLCNGCNSGLGYVDKPGWIENAQEYLDNPPAVNVKQWRPVRGTAVSAGNIGVAV